jgi:hypothetical protein
MSEPYLDSENGVDLEMMRRFWDQRQFRGVFARPSNCRQVRYAPHGKLLRPQNQAKAPSFFKRYEHLSCAHTKICTIDCLMRIVWGKWLASLSVAEKFGEVFGQSREGRSKGDDYYS